MKRVILKRSDRLPTQILVVTWVTVCTLFALVPLYVTLINAFKDLNVYGQTVFSFPDLKTLPKNTAHNFSLAWSEMNHAMGRSLMVTIIGAIIDCALGSILAYIFTYKNFHFKETLFFTYISVMLLPSIMGMPILVPFMRRVNLHNTYVGYLLPVLAGGQVGGLFLFRTFFGQQPRSIYESAQIEGANDVDIYFRLTLPLALPIILYKMVGAFSSLYNDFLWPELIFRSDKMTLMPVMKSATGRFAGGKTPEMGAMYAMYIISSVPLIFTSAISMKFFSSGDFAAGIKL